MHLRWSHFVSVGKMSLFGPAHSALVSNQLAKAVLHGGLSVLVIWYPPNYGGHQSGQDIEMLSRNKQDNVGFEAVWTVGVIWKPRAVARRLRASMLR
jgi:hypothetical protein